MTPQVILIILFCVGILILAIFREITNINESIDAFQNPPPAVCLLCRYPDPIWMDFLSSFTHYRVYVVVDSDKNISEFTNTYKTLTFIQIPDDECKAHGYMNMNYFVRKDCTAWEKAMYYFSKHASYNHVWFIEDDVFFHKESDLIHIDTQYPTSDLLSAPYNKLDKNTWSHTNHTKILHPEPHYEALCCAVRMSSALLNRIETVAGTHKTLYFLEALLPTEAHNLTYDTPDELKTITWNHVHTNFIAGNIYHPLKDITRHKKIRDSL
jgi:hypothetical protein